MRDARRGTMFDPTREDEAAFYDDGDQRRFDRGESGQLRSRQYRPDFSGFGPKNFRRSDDRIRDEIGEKLTRDPSIDASEIEIDVRDAVVILTGTVTDRAQKRRAYDIADSVTGVNDVRNEIGVQQGAQREMNSGQEWRTSAARGGASGTMTGSTRADLAPRSEPRKRTTVVGVFRDMTVADRAINELKQLGFSREDISFVTKERGLTTTGQGGTTGAETKGAATGAILGGIGGGALGWVIGIGALAIPGIGPVVAAGALATTIAGIAAGAVAGGLVGALIGLGVPENEAKRYEQRVKEGGVLVTVACVSDELRDRAKEVFNRFEAEDVEDFAGDRSEFTGARAGDGERREAVNRR